MIELWLDHKVEKCVMTFDCGGDSMNDTDFELYDKDGNTIECQELVDYFEIQVYREVEFYEASNGHYQGEFGTVTITLEGEDEEDYEFYYDKNSKSEWSETFTEETDVELTDEQVKFVSEKVLNINGGQDGSVVNYKIDCILTDEEEKIGEDLMNELQEIAETHEFKNAEGEYDGWFTFTTDIEENNTLKLEGNTLTISISSTFRVIKQEDY